MTKKNRVQRLPATRRKNVDGRPGAPARHVVVALVALNLVWLFWASRPEWDPEMRFWRAVGDASFVLLAGALAIGPLVRLWPRLRTVVLWRRAVGIWFALSASVHAYLVWDGWALWDVGRLFGYQEIPGSGVDEPIMVDPGFGLANLIGLVALSMALVLMAISSDLAMRRLGAAAWKHLQRGAYTIFYLAVLHVAYFLFMHYELGLTNLVFQKGVPEPNWFRVPFLLIAATVMGLQAAAVVRTVRTRGHTEVKDD